ncbi:hypothetical protein BYT27DRAFT_7212603 [Phlegmacium glaucopus]|nr:hypothetical protein BYT27DRAFT_7212603 [Phlegmacium glaucopus]
MSTATAFEVSEKINRIDAAIREGLQSGNIADVMKAKKSDLGWLFKTRRSLASLPNSIAKAYSARVFLWSFCLSWTKAGQQADNAFINDQLQAMTTFDHVSKGPPSAKVTKPAPSPAPARPSAQASTSALPSALAQASTSAIAPGSSTMPVQRKADSGLMIRVKPKPTPRRVAEPESEEEGSGEDDEEGEDGTRQAGRKPRPKPMRDSREMDPPCRRCVQKGQTCWMQVQGTKACYDCGRQKLGCVRPGMDSSMGVTRKQKAEASAKAKNTKRHVSQQKTKKSRSDAGSSEYEDEVEIVESKPRPKPKPKRKSEPKLISKAPVLPTRWAEGQIRRPREPSSSPIPRFSAIEKGKGKAVTNDEFQDSLANRVGYLEDIVEGLQESVTRLLVANVNLQSQIDNLERDIDRLAPFEQVADEMARRILLLEEGVEQLDEEQMPSAGPPSASASPPHSARAEIDALEAAAPASTLNSAEAASATLGTSAINLDAEAAPAPQPPAPPASVSPALNLIPPTPQTSQEEAQYATIALLQSSSGVISAPMPMPMPVTSAILSGPPPNETPLVATTSTHAAPLDMTVPGPATTPVSSDTSVTMPTTSATPSACSMLPSAPPPPSLGLLAIPTSPRTSREASPVSPGVLRRSPRLLSPGPQINSAPNNKKRNAEEESTDAGHVPKQPRQE